MMKEHITMIAELLVHVPSWMWWWMALSLTVVAIVAVVILANRLTNIRFGKVVEFLFGTHRTKEKGADKTPKSTAPHQSSPN